MFYGNEDDCEQMNIEFERTVDDLTEFNVFHLANSSSMKRQLFATQLLLSMLIPFVLIGIPYLGGQDISTFRIIYGMLAGVLMFVLFPYINRKATISRTKKVYSEGNNQAMLGHQAISLSPEGILGKNQAGESKINWSAVSELAQNEKYYFLYIGSVNAIVIPKNCFHSPEEEKAFLEYINAHREQKVKPERLSI